MAAFHSFILLQFVLSLVMQSSGLMSDYKTCGDNSCASMMSRVQAVRDHHAQDCRFLSFKKGDMIDVYYKLTRDRSDLWAGNIDTQFGYFPKDAVKIDEVFVDEQKEIEMSTQETDFFCTDAFGTVISSNKEFEDYKFRGQTSEAEELGNSDFDDRVSKASETNDNVKMKLVDDNDNKDKAEHSRPSMIGFALRGWFDEAGNENKEQETFRSRKLDTDLDQLDEERDSKIAHDTEVGPPNTMGFVKNDLQANSRDKIENNDGLSSEQSKYMPEDGIKNVFISETKNPSKSENIQSLTEQQKAGSLQTEDLAETITAHEKTDDSRDAGWYNRVYNRITSLYWEPSDKSESGKDERKKSLSDPDMDRNKVMINTDEKNPEPRLESFVIHGLQSERNTANQDENQEVTSQDHSDGTSQLSKGWYGSIFNRITGFYGDNPNDKSAPDTRDVIGNSREDPHVNSETVDLQSIQDQKLEHHDDKFEEMSEHNNVGQYDGVYSRISSMYLDMSDKINDEISDVMKNVESQTHIENIKDTSSQSIFSINGLPSVFSGQKSSSNEAGSEDKTKSSESATLEPSQTQFHVSTDQNDAMTLSSDDEDTRGSGLADKEIDDHLTDVGQSQDTVQSVFPLNHLSLMIDSLKSQFKPNNLDDQKVSDKEKTFETSKASHSNNDKEDSHVDELSAKSMDVISEVSTTKATMGSQQKEQVLQEEIVAASLVNKNDIETLPEDPAWTELAKHGSDTSKDHEQDPNSNSIPFPDTPSEDPQSESQTESHLDLQVRTDFIENISETVGEADESQDKNGSVDVLRETEQAGMKVRSSDGAHTIYRVSEDEKHGVNISQMEYDGKKESAETELSGETESVNNTLMEHDEERGIGSNKTENYGGIGAVDASHMKSNGEKEHMDATDMKSDGEEENLNMTQAESGREKEAVVTHVEYSEGHNVDESELESGGDKDLGQGKYAGGKHLADTVGESKSGKALQVESGGGQDGVDLSETEANGEIGDVNITQAENVEEKGDEITQRDGEKEGVIFIQKESDGEKDVDIVQKEQLSLHTAHGLANTHSFYVTRQSLETDPGDSRESEGGEYCAVKQVEILAKSIQDEIPETDYSEAAVCSMTSEDQTDLGSKKCRIKIMDDKHNKEQTSPQTQERSYPKLQTHLNEEDMQNLLKFLGIETLSWLDFVIGHFEDINHKELTELHDFEKTLEHHLKTNNQEIKPSLQTIQNVLANLRRTFTPVIADGNVDKSPDQSKTECVKETCINDNENTPNAEQDTGKDNILDNNSENNIDNSMDNNVDNIGNSFSLNDLDSLISSLLSNDKQVVTDKNPVLDDRDNLKFNQKTAPQLDTIFNTEELPEPEKSPNEGVLQPYMVLITGITSCVLTYMVKGSAHVKHAIHKVVMSLPDDMKPGPDLYGLPWDMVIISSILGLFIFLLITCRFVQSVKSRIYCSKERRMGQKVAELLEEKCKVLETLSECEHKFKKLEAALQNGGLSAEDSERENLKVTSKKLEEANAQIKNNMEKMQKDLDAQDQIRNQQEEQLTKLEEMLKTLEKEATERKSQLEQDKTTLKIHEMNTERLQKKLQAAKEENNMLMESKAQLEQEAEGWKERLSELEEEKKMSETSHNGMMENCKNKDEHIKSLTECLLKMRDWDSEEEESTGNDTSVPEKKHSSEFKQKQKVQKLIDAAKASADLKAMEDDKNRMFSKLTDEIKAKEDLQEGLQQLQREKESLESESTMYSTEIEKLQQKLQIMSDMYQEKELKLHRMLTVEEKEHSQKQEQLNKAGKKISLTTDELKSYRQRAKELEEELDKTNQAYKNQIAAHEKKAHDNWLAARAADRDLTDAKRENSVLRQRLTDWQFKLELMEKNPQARVPLFRGERSPFGPSPLGRPPSETRPFLSPPTLMDGPPRVSPQFPMMPSSRAPPGVVDGDKSISYSESGSPTWEKERERRSLGPPGPDPGLMYRRPLSAPFLRAPLPPEAYHNEKSSDSSFGGEGDGYRENGSVRLMPGTDIRAGPFPPLDPHDPQSLRRGYPPDFFPPPPLAMRGPPRLPPGVFPRIPLPPHMAFPPMRPPTDHISPEPPSRPSPPGSEQPPQHPPSAHDVI